MPFAAIALMIVGGFFAVMNWACLISSIVTKKNHSMVPPLGGLLLSVGFALHPVLRPFTICGLLLDIGFWALLFAIPMMLGEALRAAPWRRVARISGQWNEITFHLSLYRPDYYVVKVSREVPPGKTGWIGRGSFGRWSSVGSGLQLVSHMDTDESLSRLTLLGGLESTDLPVAESTYSPGDRAPEFPPAGVVLHSH